MSVLRVNHQKNYVVINKDVLENPNLSFKAKGLWAYCMSRPNDWEFHVSHLAKISKDKEDAVYSAIKELETQGYVRKIQKNEAGRFGRVDYEISEIQIILPLAGFPDAGFPDAGNPALLSNKYNQVMKETPPLPPHKPKDCNPQNSQELKRKMISLGFKEEEYQEAWRRYLKQPEGSVGHVKSWMKTTLESIRIENEAKAEKYSIQCKQRSLDEVRASEEAVLVNEKKNQILKENAAVFQEFSRFFTELEYKLNEFSMQIVSEGKETSEYMYDDPQLGEVLRYFLAKRNQKCS